MEAAARQAQGAAVQASAVAAGMAVSKTAAALRQAGFHRQESGSHRGDLTTALVGERGRRSPPVGAADGSVDNHPIAARVASARRREAD